MSESLVAYGDANEGVMRSTGGSVVPTRVHMIRSERAFFISPILRHHDLLVTLTES